MSEDLKSKKRKREESSAGDADGRPSAKQARSESPFKDGEDLPLALSDAHKILTVLETYVSSAPSTPPPTNQKKKKRKIKSRLPTNALKGSIQMGYSIDSFTFRPQHLRGSA